MNKKSKDKTTLDKRHKEQLNIFENKSNNLDDIKNKIKKNEILLEKLNKIPFIEYSKQQIDKRAHILTEIKELKKQINIINKNQDELLYFNNTIDYILPYYEQSSKQSDVKHMEIIDFFNNSNMIQSKDSSSNNKAQLLDNYLKVVDSKQIRVTKNKKFKPKYCSNKDCSSEMTLHLSDGYLVCTECGFCEEVILDSDKPNYKDPIPDATTYSYKRINHFNELTNWSNNLILVC